MKYHYEIGHYAGWWFVQRYTKFLGMKLYPTFRYLDSSCRDWEILGPESANEYSPMWRTKDEAVAALETYLHAQDGYKVYAVDVVELPRT